MNRIAIIIPCYNEAQRIEKTLNNYFDYFNNHQDYQGKHVVFVLVDDGSQDNTIEILKKLQAKSTNHIIVKAVGYPQNQGKGAAIKYGCAQVEADIYGFVDADLSFEAKFLDQAIKMVGNNDLVIGQRDENITTTQYSKWRKLISKALRRIINFVVGLPNVDTQCGLKFFSSSVVKNILSQVQENRFAYDIELICLAGQNQVKITPLPLIYMGNDQSSITWKDGFRYLFDVVAIADRVNKIKPIKLFSYLFFFALLISLIVYGRFIFTGYLFSDDFTWLWQGQKIGNSFYQILSMKMSTFYSPVMNAFYSIIYSIFGFTVKPLFLLGLLIHSLVAGLLGFFSWQLSRSTLLSGLVTLMFGLIGVAYEPIVWVSANMHSIVTMFIVGTLIFMYQYLEQRKWWWLFFSFIAYLLALGTKESAIVTPGLMLITFIFYKIKYSGKKVFNFSAYLFLSGVVIVSGYYIFQQYLWQKHGIWVQSDVWTLNWQSLLRWPLIVFDNFFPLMFFDKWLTNYSALVLTWLIFVILIFILWRMKNKIMIWYSLLWLLITALPFVFFQVEPWWWPLASRYNYLLHFGAVLVISHGIYYLIVNNRARHIISGWIWLILFLIIMQTAFMIIKTGRDYDYVYATGKSLATVMTEIAEKKIDKIFVAPVRPFEGNQAHIVGAASLLANKKEDQIFFLININDYAEQDNSVLLYWDTQSNRYLIK